MKIHRLGIIGTGRIANRFVPELGFVPQIKPVIVCNPHLESARKFADQYGVARYTQQVEDLAGIVDAVYIASPHETHYEYAKYMLSNGIHVLCEKPMAFSEQQAAELFQIAGQQKCILMEGIKTAYCPGFQKILELVGAGTIGEVRDVEACFSRLYSGNTRELRDTVYGGSYTEYGTYTLLPIVKLLGTNNIDAYHWSLKGDTGVDIYTKRTIVYEQAIATAKTGLGVKSEGQLVIAGTKGYILVPSPWWLTKKIEVRYEDPNQIDVYETPFEGQGLRYEIRAFVDKITMLRDHDWKNVMYQPSGVTPEESIWLAGQIGSGIGIFDEK